MWFNSKWYNLLSKPFLNPPSYVFRPVWTILYVTILVALAIYVFKNTDRNKFKGYIYFSIQVILNALWSPLFFYFKNMKTAFIVIILLDIFVLLNIKEFYRVSKVAGLILIPYFLWIAFATYLNFGFILLNEF